ncbi:MAG: adenosylcobinamide-phosphate synthase CbiB [Brotaphodocola sp.]
MDLYTHMAAFAGGFLLDLWFGDPCWMPHPIRLIGTMISRTEAWLWKKEEQRDSRKEFRRGIGLVCVVLTGTAMLFGMIFGLSYFLNPFLGMVVEMIMTYQILAAKCLKTESMKVYDCLKKKDLESSRTAVSMIVGRDTAVLDEIGVAKAAIETVAENTSDGVIAPMLYTAVGGPVLGLLYKAVNTMDSMVGYKNERYLYFGRAAAKLDDLVNFLPARLSAYLMILAAFCSGKAYSGKQALAVWKRDRRKHASPNSAQTEAVCAGALGIQLAGDASYFGKVVKKPYIGDAVRPVEYEDIRRANHLMYQTAWFCQILCLAGLTIACLILRE